MLKQVRHISEGNFYGLRVTNKARKLSLDKELRTLEACKDAQSHVYRKEEKELISTLKRLQHTKHDHFGNHEDHEQPERVPSHHDRHPSSRQPSNDEHRHLRRPAERHHGKVQVKVKSEMDDQKSSVPCRMKVVTNASDVSVIISLSPIASSATDAKPAAAASLPPVMQPPKREAGTDIHRTQAFTSCVICNLPRYAQGRENNNVCTCHADPSQHPHHRHQHQEGSNKRRKSHTDDEDLKRFAAKRERRRSLEIDDLSAPHTAKKNHLNPATHHRHQGRSRTCSFEEDNRTQAPEIVPVTTRAFDEYAAYVPGVGAHRHTIREHNTTLTEQTMRSRGATLRDTRSRQNSLDEGRSRWNSYTEGRSRDNSLGEHDEPHYMKPLKGHYGSRHNRTRQEEELHELYNRLQRVFHHGEDGAQYQGEHPHATHLPLSKSRRDAHTKADDPSPAFSGLLHPDNIINHHHFLPHEASKRDKPRTHHAPHPPPHQTAYHVMGIDRHGNRQEVSGTTWLKSTSSKAMTIFLKHFQYSLAVFRKYVTYLSLGKRRNQLLSFAVLYTLHI